MRILFLTNFYPPYEMGGYEQWCAEVAGRLEGRGHQVFILTSRYKVPAGQPLVNGAIDRSLYLQAPTDYYRPADFFFRRPVEERRNLSQLRQAIARFQPDLLMVWGMWNLSHSLPAEAERLLPGRVAYFISNYWPTDPDPHREYWQLPTGRKSRALIKAPLKAMALAALKAEGYPPSLQMQHAVCCSQYVRDTLVGAGRLPSQAGVLLGGTDPAEFLRYSRLAGKGPAARQGSLRLLYFGRLVKEKGVHTALEALGLLRQRGLENEMELTILGSGHPEYEARLHSLVEQLGLGERVQFVRQIPRPQVPEWLGQFDVFLFTSVWPEPMARSVMEAMAAGLLVIGTEVGGQKEMLSNGENALTFQPEDAAGLADQIARAITSPELCRRLACAGQEMVVERFTLDRMVNEIERYLENVLKTGLKLSEIA